MEVNLIGQVLTEVTFDGQIEGLTIYVFSILVDDSAVHLIDDNNAELMESSWVL